MKILVIGGSGGIGLAMVKQLLNNHHRITASYYRNKPALEHANLHWQQLNINDENSIKHLADEFTELDWLINTVGLLHNDEQQPEKSIKQLDSDFFIESLTTNTLATLLLAKHFSKQLKKSKHAKFVALSARVGSISDNGLGGWYSYRISKTALNMAIKNLSNEWQHSHPNLCALALHPGTVNTELSKPFQKNVQEEKLFSPEFSAECLLGLIAKATTKDSGSFWAWDGKNIEW